jgi:isopentenyldiphosphate isomerase
MAEILDIVDDNDRIVGQELRSIVHAHGLQHRGVHVFLFTRKGKLLIQKRSANRASSPSRLDCSVSEHVQAGESYLEAAVRGMQEELGLTGIEVSPLVTFKMNYGLNDNEISRLFKGVVNPGEVKFDPVEIEEVGYYSMEEIKAMLAGDSEKFCGWFVEIMNWYLGNSSRVQVLNPGLG